MYLNTLEVALTPRTTDDSYNVQLNQAVLDILSLLFEFKVATSWQITRFLTQRDESKYLYLKLRRMWQAGLLESFKVYTGSRAGMPVYYMLSKRALRILVQQGKYHPSLLKNYPQAKTLFSWGVFKHEAQVVELASQEIKNGSTNFTITFRGEVSSGAHDMRSDKNIEVFTPDYTVFYKMGGLEECIYTEFERTSKSIQAMGRKVERYVLHLDPKEREHTTLRLIFQTPNMEHSFWINLMQNNATFLQKLRVLTTNLLFLEHHTQFLEPIYSSDKTIKFAKHGRLSVDTKERVKLFSFL